MRVRHLMTSNVYTCASDDTLTDAARIMWDKDCGCLPVVDSGRRPIAMITDRDVCMAAFTQGVPLHAARVSSAMSKSVVTIARDRTLSELEQLLRERQLRRVPVVDEQGRLVGIATLADLAQHANSGKLRKAFALPAVGKTLAEVTERRDELGPSRDEATGQERAL